MRERLTKQSEAMDGIVIPIAFAESCGEMGCAEICEEHIGNACKGCPVQEIFQTLAQYETSGLSPEEAQKLAKAQAEDRLVELPCKIGDTLFSARWRLSNQGKRVFLTKEKAEKAVRP